VLKTRIIKFNDQHLDADGIDAAVEVLRSGGLIAFPTETVYGLGADAMNVEAVHRVFDAKGRPSDNPLIVHIAALENSFNFTDALPEKGLRLAEIFWPGPLTLIVEKKGNVPDIVTANLDTVALRVPKHPVTLQLLKIFNGGIVGPSANISGRPSPTRADHVFNDLNGKIDIIIDAGPTTIGIESTVIDVTIDPPVILRVGGLSKEDIEMKIGKVNLTKKDELLNRSPGTRHRHYSPKAHVIIFPQGDREKFLELIQQSKKRAEKAGSITYSGELKEIEKSNLHIVLESSVDYYARHLFQALRDLDSKATDVIYVESVKEEGIGAAIMDRLRKAAV
jgi:L-threonylcarbamoyladenylate synthase